MLNTGTHSDLFSKKYKKETTKLITKNDNHYEKIFTQQTNFTEAPASGARTFHPTPPAQRGVGVLQSSITYMVRTTIKLSERLQTDLQLATGQLVVPMTLSMHLLTMMLVLLQLEPLMVV